jgi:hypothetical protein
MMWWHAGCTSIERRHWISLPRRITRMGYARTSEIRRSRPRQRRFFKRLLADRGANPLHHRAGKYN